MTNNTQLTSFNSFYDAFNSIRTWGHSTPVATRPLPLPNAPSTNSPPSINVSISPSTNGLLPIAPPTVTAINKLAQECIAKKQPNEVVKSEAEVSSSTSSTTSTNAPTSVGSLAHDEVKISRVETNESRFRPLSGRRCEEIAKKLDIPFTINQSPRMFLTNLFAALNLIKENVKLTTLTLLNNGKVVAVLTKLDGITILGENLDLPMNQLSQKQSDFRIYANSSLFLPSSIPSVLLSQFESNIWGRSNVLVANSSWASMKGCDCLLSIYNELIADEQIRQLNPEIDSVELTLTFGVNSRHAKLSQGKKVKESCDGKILSEIHHLDWERCSIKFSPPLKKGTFEEFTMTK